MSESRKRHIRRLNKPSQTQQHFRDGCIPSKIIARMQRLEHGLNVEEHLGSVNLNYWKNPGKYGDFSRSFNYEDARNLLLDATANFELLPSDIREFFANDPKIFIDYIDNPNSKYRNFENVKDFDGSKLSPAELLRRKAIYMRCQEVGLLAPDKKPDEETPSQEKAESSS